MAILLGLDSVSHEWPGKRVLIEQTIGIEAGDRIGIVGKNGDGKSSLLEIIEGQVEPIRAASSAATPSPWGRSTNPTS